MGGGERGEGWVGERGREGERAGVWGSERERERERVCERESVREREREREGEREGEIKKTFSDAQLLVGLFPVGWRSVFGARR